jgi:2'-5' RNA ligase superfamily
MTQPEYFITHFTDSDVPTGTRLESWPIHFTVVPPFIIHEPSTEERVLELMLKEGRETVAIPLFPGKIEKFGPEDKPEEMFDAIKINDPTLKLHRLHSRLLRQLVTINCEFKNLNPAWSGDNYNPHISLKGRQAPEKPFVVTTLSLTKKDDEGKSVVATVDIADAETNR